MSDTFESLSFYDRSGLGFNWREDAACKGLDPNIFHPSRGEDTRTAKAICAGCLVVNECLEFALANFIKVGVWGGLSERQRRSLRKERKGE